MTIFEMAPVRHHEFSKLTHVTPVCMRFCFMDPYLALIGQYSAAIWPKKMIFQMASVLSICEISISPQNLKIFGHVIILRVSIRISIPLSST